MQPPEVRRALQERERKLDNELRRDKRKLFEALGEFANIPSKRWSHSWSHFRKRWPNFFPEEEYKRAAKGSVPNVLGYPSCLDQAWMGEASLLRLLLGIDAAYRLDELSPEDMWLADLCSIAPKFFLDWDEGIFRYRGACDFQRALYLLFLESWRARFCAKCSAKFIARRAAQKYCSTDCSENIQCELKRKWWDEHGRAWRRDRKRSTSKRKGGINGTRKTR